MNRIYLLPILAGTLYALGFPSKIIPHIPLFTIVGLCILFFPFFAKRKISLISWTLLFSLGYCLQGYYWIPYTLKEFGNIYFPFNYILGTLFSLIIVPQILILFFSLSKIQKLKIWNKNSLDFHIIFISLSATLLEYYIPQQFPAHPGHTWLFFAPYLKLATIFGAPVFSFISYLIALSLVIYITKRYLSYISIGAVIILLAINFSSKIPSYKPKSDDKINISIVQANIGNFLKTSSENGGFDSMTKVHDTYHRLSTSKEDSDLIIWPETAYPSLMSSELLKRRNYLPPLLIKKIIEETQAELFTGGYDTKGFDRDYFQTEFNSAFLFSQNFKLKNVYHKIKLIPFGEGLPFGPLNKYLARPLSNISFFAKGDKYTLFQTKGFHYTSLICYEVLFSSFVRSYLNSLSVTPDFIINLTNDSWYGDTAEPYQHLFLSSWRAIEFNIPIIRSTNTGISTVIYPDGSYSKNLGVFKEGVLSVELSKNINKGSTFFQHFSTAPLILLGMGLLALSWILKRKDD